jgi:hypothetical protein
MTYADSARTTIATTLAIRSGIVSTGWVPPQAMVTSSTPRASKSCNTAARSRPSVATLAATRATAGETSSRISTTAVQLVY